jgi:hypothetical protein
MSQSRVADADATETHISQTRYERTHPAWLDGRLARAALVDGAVVVSVHQEHMRPELLACLNRIVAAEPRWQHAVRINEATEGQFTVRFQRVSAEQLPDDTCAISVRGDLGTVWLVREEGMTEALAAELGPFVASLVNGGTWGEQCGHRQAS